MAHAERLGLRRRPLAPSEKRLLASRAGDLRARASGTTKMLLLCVGVVAALYALTLAASDVPWEVITLFWFVAGGLLCLWVWYDARRDLGHAAAMADRLVSARAADLAEVYDIRSTRYVEFAELEDEGACYAFEIEPKTLVFVQGQAFYRSARFPSLDFSLVFPLDDAGVPVDMWIEKRGQAATPDRVIPAEVKWRLDLPDTLEVFHGDLDRIESLLPDSRGR